MTSFDRLLRSTPARLDVGRAGSRPRTPTLLAFRRDHAAARDAVWSEWSPDFLAHLVELGFLIVASAALDRESFVLNPGLGRQLAPGEADRIRAANASISAFPATGPSRRGQTKAAPQGERNDCADGKTHAVQLVLSDGLSAIAGEKQCDAIVPRLIELLSRFLLIAQPVAVRNGRVAIADGIALAAGTTLVVHLIGERPGLQTAESLGCYLTFAPGASTTDADRKCISNIHAAGLNPAEAAASIAGLAQRIIAAGTSGTALVL